MLKLCCLSYLPSLYILSFGTPSFPELASANLNKETFVYHYRRWFLRIKDVIFTYHMCLKCLFFFLVCCIKSLFIFALNFFLWLYRSLKEFFFFISFLLWNNLRHTKKIPKIVQRVSMIVHLDSLNVMSYVTVVHNYIYQPHEISIGNSIVISRPYSDLASCPAMFLLIPRLHFQLSSFLSLLIWSSLFSLYFLRPRSL